MTTPEQVLRAYETALATQDWAQIAPFFHEKACVTFTEGTYCGLAEISAAFQRTFALIQDEEYAIRDLRWLMQAEAYAVAIYTFHWRGLIRGEPAAGSGRGTTVLVQTDTGWQILTEHLGPAPR